MISRKTAERLFAAVLAVIMTLGTLAFAENEEVNDCTEYVFPDIFDCVLEGQPTCTAEKTEFDGRKAVKVTPTPETKSAAVTALDSWSLAKDSKRADLAKYRFVKITYYLSPNAKAAGNMGMRLLPGNTKAIKTSATVYSYNELVSGKWADAYFKLDGKFALNPDSENTHINQVHFYPYGNVPSSSLSKDDVMYISSVSFFERNPDGDAKSTVTYLKGAPNAYGKLFTETYGANTSFTAAKCPYTMNESEFVAWRTSDGRDVKPGEKLEIGDSDITLTAVWKSSAVVPETSCFAFSDCFDSILEGYDTSLTKDKVVENGFAAVKFAVNTKAQKSSSPLGLDGWSYLSKGIDLRNVKRMYLVYKYESKSPVGAKMKINIMKNGGILESAFGAESKEPVTTGEWSVAEFDISGIAEKILPESGGLLRQMHIYPLGMTPVSKLSEGDTVYVAAVAFSLGERKPSFEYAYMNGYENGCFKPSGHITRAEATAVAARAAGIVPVSDKSGYSDVAESAWYAGYVSALAKKGALANLDKTTDGAFEPSRKITRAELAEVIMSLDLPGCKESGDAPKFTDIKSGDNHYDTVVKAAVCGIINGYPDGSFKPDSPVTRAEAAAIVNRALGYTADKNDELFPFYNVFADVNRSHWAFFDIASASVPRLCLGEDKYALGSPSLLFGENLKPDTEQGDAELRRADEYAEKRIAQIRSTPNTVDPAEAAKKGTVYYVSESGSDENDGKSLEKAWRTTERVGKQKLNAGDTVLFERGGLYRGGMFASSGVTYSSYGEGAKPIICGSPEDGADPGKWTLHSDTDGVKVWKYDTGTFPDVGAITMNDGEYYAKREVPSYRDGRFYVRGKDIPFEVEKHLPYDLCYFHKADSVIKNGIPDSNEAKGELYLRCDKGNPGDVFDRIEFSTKTRAFNIQKTSSVTIDNLCFMYCAAAAVGGTGPVDNLTVTNCEAAFIGGTIQTYNFRNATDGRVTRAGNGIETYGTTDGFTVDNCYVRQVYDAGLSHQVADGGSQDIDMSNISYTNNVVEDCVYGIEYFNGAAVNESVVRTGENILIEGNIIRRTGYGFGSTRPDGYAQAAIKSWDHRNEFWNFKIKNNIFALSTWYLIHINAAYPEWLPEMSGNTYIQTAGGKFAIFGKNRIDTGAELGYEAERTIGDKSGKYFASSIGIADFPDKTFNLSRYGIYTD